MHGLPQLILLQANGYKALAATNGDSSRSFALDLQEKIARVAEGDLNATVDFTHGNEQIGVLGVSFNHMVEQLREGRNEIDRLHRSQISQAEHMATVAEVMAGLVHEIRNGMAGFAGWIEIAGRDLPTTSPACALVKDVCLEIAEINRLLRDLLQTARPHTSEDSCRSGKVTKVCYESTCPPQPDGPPPYVGNSSTATRNGLITVMPSIS